MFPYAHVRCGLLLLLVVSCLCLAGCEDIIFKEEFSINLMQPGPKWPKKEKNLSPAQRQVFQKYGRPEFFRIWWTPNGDIRTRAELHAEMKEKKKPDQMPAHTWVYVNRGKEILFRGGSYQELPLTDQVKILTQYGDPEDVKTQSNGIVQWQYFGAGKLYKFVRGQVVEQKEFPAMGEFIK